jgi:hypothetical protein
VRYLLLPNQRLYKIPGLLQKGVKKGRTLEVERNGGQPYGDHQHPNNYISVPNRNARGIDENKIPNIAAMWNCR